jgi:hypothetical protein
LGGIVSSDFDFFAGQRTPSSAAPAAASAWAPPAQVDQRFGSTTDAWQPLATPPTGQFAPASRSSRAPLAILAVLAVAAIAGGAFYISTRPHPVPLPATLAGLAKVSLPSAQAHELDSDTHSLRSDGAHDVSVAVYGALSGAQPGLIVIAGRTASTVPDSNQLAGAVGQVGQITGGSVAPQTLTSGASTFECATVSSQSETIRFCAWQGSHAVLLGFGEQISAQDTVDALEQTRLGANLS